MLDTLAATSLNPLPQHSTYRPFPIIMGSILLDTPLGFYPFEVRLRG